MRSSDWSSDVCSSGLQTLLGGVEDADAQSLEVQHQALEEFVGLPVVLELDKARDTVEVTFLLLLHDEPEGHVVDSRDTIHAHPLELVVTETKEAVDLFEVLPHEDRKSTRLNSSH